jgi:hypothetical protein
MDEAGEKRELEALLVRARAAGLLTEHGVLRENFCLEKAWLASDEGGGNYRWRLLRIKHTENSYTNHSLRIMYAKAREYIGDLAVLPEAEPDYAVPEALEKLLHQPAREEELWERYLHISAVDMEPRERNIQRPLGYYTTNSVFFQVGMQLDDNPTGPRRLFSNSDVA